MKSASVYLLTLSFILFSCKSDYKEPPTQGDDLNKNSVPATLNNPIHEISLAEYSNLAPIELKNSKTTDVYKKYGIEFSGNCYACDLAIFKLNKKNFDLVILCDENDFHRFKDFDYKKRGDVLKIKTSETTFIFTKVENEAVYQLKIEGQKPKLKNKRFSEFYTPQNLIEKFEEHDCGDFQG